MKKRLIALISAAVFCLSGVIPASAAETNNEKLYTMAELIDMSEEEFFALDSTAKELYDYMKYKTEHDLLVYVRGLFYTNIRLEPNYQPYKSEEKIAALLGDSVKYTMSSPLEKTPEYDYYYDGFSIYFDNLYEMSGHSDYYIDQLLINTKFQYCINQVLNFTYCSPTWALTSNPKKLIYGDVNDDGLTNIADAVNLAKHGADPTAYPISTYSFFAADINADHEVTNADLVDLIKMI